MNLGRSSRCRLWTPAPAHVRVGMWVRLWLRVSVLWLMLIQVSGQKRQRRMGRLVQVGEDEVGESTMSMIWVKRTLLLLVSIRPRVYPEDYSSCSSYLGDCVAPHLILTLNHPQPRPIVLSHPSSSHHLPLSHRFFFPHQKTIPNLQYVRRYLHNWSMPSLSPSLFPNPPPLRSQRPSLSNGKLPRVFQRRSRRAVHLWRRRRGLC